MENQQPLKPTPGMLKIVSIAKLIALNMQSEAIRPEHYILAMLQKGDGSGVTALLNLDVDVQALMHRILSLATANPMPLTQTVVVPDADARRVMEAANNIARGLGHNHVGTEHLLLGLVREPETVPYKVLSEFGVTYQGVEDEMNKIMGHHADRARHDDAEDSMSDDDEPDMSEGASDDEDGEESEPPPMRFGRRTREGGKSARTMLSRFTRNLSELAAEGRIDPVIGRDGEIERMLQVLCRRKKNNPVLLGESGVGKTAIVEGLANFIAQDKVPDILRDYRVLSLDMGALVAGTKFRGQFEERIEGIMRELRKSPKTILFIDEMHTIIGAGQAEGSLDAAGILKPALARGELQCIGATTQEEYRRFVRKDTALARRFQPITVSAPSVDDTVLILNGLKSYYEDHHKVIISDEAVWNAVQLSDRYITDRHLPDKAIDIIDEAGAHARLKNSERPKELLQLESDIRDIGKKIQDELQKEDKNFELCAVLKEERKALEDRHAVLEEEWHKKKTGTVITADDVAVVVSKWTGVPVAKIDSNESKKLLNLEDTISKRVVSQKEALNAIGRAIRRARAGLKDPSRPMASFLFLGPTGVGKTELAKALANFMFGTDDAMIRIDMSEYSEKIAITRLIGAPPGYVGHEGAGQLTEKVRQRPYSVILFDEIEKAHPDVFNLLLQVLDDGRLTDSVGNTIDFRNAIIIMTSNAGSRDLHKGRLGFNNVAPATDRQMIVNKVKTAIKQTFTPEFLNRLDDSIIFEPLNRVDISAIVRIMIDRLNLRLKDRGITLTIETSAEDFLIEEGYAPEYGARPMRRAIQKFMEDPLSQMILEGTAPSGSIISATRESDKTELTFAVVQTEKPKETAVSDSENEESANQASLHEKT